MRFTASLILLIALVSSGSQPWLNGLPDKVKFHTISIGDGLSQSTVRCIARDKKGFMWFGTDDGLNKYDGYTFEIFRPVPGDPDSLSHNRISVIYEDLQGDLWIGTREGLNRYNRELEKFRRYPRGRDGLTGKDIRAIVEDKLGNLWIGSADGGLCRYDREKETFFSYLRNEMNPGSLLSTHVTSLHVDQKGELWVGTHGAGLARFDHVNKRFVYILPLPETPNESDNPGNIIRAIGEDLKGNLWFASLEVLYRMESGSDKLVEFKPNPNPLEPIDKGKYVNNLVTAFCTTSSGDLLIGTEEGLDRYNPGDNTFTHYRNEAGDPYSISNNIILSIFEDPSGILWVGTEGSGVCKFANRMTKFPHYWPHPLEYPGHLRGQFVYCIYEDADGITWLGTEKGLNRFDSTTGSYTFFKPEPGTPHKLSGAYIMSIVDDREGALWVGSWGGGLNRFDRETQRFKTFRFDGADTVSLSHNDVRLLYKDHLQRLWIGTNGGGLNKFEQDRERFIHYRTIEDDPKSLSNDVITTICDDRAGNLWIGTHHGLNRFDPETGANVRYYSEIDNENSLCDNTVNYIHLSPTGYLWIGTAGGLNKFAPVSGRFVRYHIKDGLPNTFINAILEDDDGILWVTTNQGLSRFDPRKEEFRNYTLKDGLQSNEFNIGSCYRNSKGEMYFGGVNGFNRFHPDAIRDSFYNPPVVITGFSVFNQRQSPGPDAILKKSIVETQRIELSYRDSVFSFEFASLDYAFPGSNMYSYMMEGLDSDWIDSGSRRYASYHSQMPGTYIFRVKGTNSDGVQSDEEAAITVVITPPFFQTWWFRGMALLFLGLTVLAAYTARTRSMRRRNRELEEVNVQLNRHISDREAAEEKLLKSERRLRTFLETASEGFIEVDNRETILDVNPEMCTILGRVKKSIIGRSILDFVSPGDRNEFQRHLEKRREGQRSTYGLSLLKPGGTAVHCLISGAPLYDETGNKKGSFAMITDISEMTQAEEELINTKNYLDNVFNSLSSILITVNRDGVITQWNSAAERFFNTDSTYAVSRKLFHVAPFMGNYHRYMAEVLESGKPVELLRQGVTLPGPGGKDTKYYLDVLIYPMVYRSGGVEDIVFRLEDVTEMEYKDRQLIQAQKMETVGNLAGGLAHDFNNVLGGIVGTVSLLKYKLKEPKDLDPADIKARIEVIEKGAERAVSLVKQLLTISRRADPMFAPVDLNHSMKHVVKICENTFDKSIRLEANRHSQPAMAHADANQIEQVLLNLCVNASHAMTLMREKDQPQGGTLSVSISPFVSDSHFRLSHPEAEGDDYWLVKVEDTGVGMDAETVSQIFDPFFTTKVESKGTGLGLAMVFNIIQQHKGFINVYSQLGEGTVFNVFLPLLQESTVSEEEKAKAEHLETGAGLILVVDDEEHLRKTTCEILETCGYRVITAVDGEEGVEKYRRQKDEIDLVLLDMAMPKMSGKQTFVALRSVNPDVSVLLTSGFRQDRRVKEVIKLGIDGFIQKPFTMSELSSKVSRLMGKKMS